MYNLYTSHPEGLLAFLDPVIFWILIPGMILWSILMIVHEARAYKREKDQELYSWEEILNEDSAEVAQYYAEGLIASWCEGWNPHEARDPQREISFIFEEMGVNPTFKRNGRICDPCDWR